MAGHIPGARFADLNLDLSAPVTAASGRHPLPAPEIFAARFGEVGIGDETQVVAYDEANGSFAARAMVAAEVARTRSRRGARRRPQGLGRGRRRGRVGRDCRGRRAARFTPRSRPAGRAQHRGSRARAAGRHARCWWTRAPRSASSGSVEPIDPVAGHVPGAVNHPFTANLGADGRFLPAAELKRRWRERLAGKNAASCRSPCAAPASPPAIIC